MKSKKKLESALNELADAIIGVEGTIAAILFGSRARGDYQEHSDYDLLVIFQNDQVMLKNRRELYQNIAKTGLFTQVLTRSLRELQEESDPIFLKTILKQGRLLYARHPIQLPAIAYQLRPMAIISYNLNKLSQKDKMKVAYRLYGRKTSSYRYPGLVEKCKGIHLGPGSLMIPWEKNQRLTAILDSFNINYTVKRVFRRKITIGNRDVNDPPTIKTRMCRPVRAPKVQGSGLSFSGTVICAVTSI